MGKYMKKAKASSEVAVMEVAQSHQTQLGVSTRSRTLALQKNNTNTDSSSAATAAGDFLQLRSRRLEKPPPPMPKKVDREIGKSKSKNIAAAAAVMGETVQSHHYGGSFEEWVDENALDAENRSRNVRETTPCSFIRDSENISTPGSTTRPSSSTATNRRSQFSVPRNIPTAHEMEEFFSGAEQLQQRLFIEKYNYDPVNDLPLPGRYEWVHVDS